VHLIAGATAGTAEHCGMFPIDTIKTHIQALKPPNSSGLIVPHIGTIQTTRNIIAQWGPGALFRGLTAVAAGAAPAHAIYFATYEACKSKMGGDKPGHHPLASSLSGIVATVASDAVLSPTDAIKQRMQLHLTPYRNVVDCIKQVIRREGWKTFYAGYTTTLVMNVPYNAIYFTVYESLVKVLQANIFQNSHTNSNNSGSDSGGGDSSSTNSSNNSSPEYRPIVHFLGGGGAGMIASGFTNPFDVARTRLQTQGELTGRKYYRGMLHALRTIWKEEGMAGYTRGVKPRMIFHSMSAAICWSVYEYVKVLLT